MSPLTTPPSHRGSVPWPEVVGLVSERDAVGARGFAVQQKAPERLAVGHTGNGQQFLRHHFVRNHGVVSLYLCRRGRGYLPVLQSKDGDLIHSYG